MGVVGLDGMRSCRSNSSPGRRKLAFRTDGRVQGSHVGVCAQCCYVTCVPDVLRDCSSVPPPLLICDHGLWLGCFQKPAI